MFLTRFVTLIIDVTSLWKWFLEGKTEILVHAKNNFVMVLIQHAQASEYFIYNKFICPKEHMYMSWIYLFID